MDEIVKAWVRPEYLPMLTLVALTTKFLMVPILKNFFTTSPSGSTSVSIAVAGSVVLSFLYRVLNSLGTWTPESIVMTIIVGILAGFTAIGTNVTVQVLRGNNVSIKKV
jgi:hypothetical protein